MGWGPHCRELSSREGLKRCGMWIQLGVAVPVLSLMGAEGRTWGTWRETRVHGPTQKVRSAKKQRESRGLRKTAQTHKGMFVEGKGTLNARDIVGSGEEGRVPGCLG